jgi:hypothetical protein
MMHAKHIENDRQLLMLTTIDERVEKLSLTDCVLKMDRSSLQVINTYHGGRKDSKEFPRSSSVSVPLKDLDVSSIKVDEDKFMTDEPASEVFMRTREAAGATITSTTGHPAKALGIDVDSKQDGERIANAIRHAATLCGAPASAF